MEMHKGFEALVFQSAEEFRNWLEQHAGSHPPIWLVFYRNASFSVSQAIDEALCFGWIDSKPNKRDTESYYLFFSPRNPKSRWSAVNKEKVRRLLAEGRIATPGLRMIELAQSTGTWDALNAVNALEIPNDLDLALNEKPPARQHFEAFPPSVKRGILEWILSAKTTATRQKRIQETAQLAQFNLRANQYPPQKIPGL